MISVEQRELMQEIAKFEKSFKDPKFMELLADYAKDMADPEVMLSRSCSDPKHMAPPVN